MPLPKTLESNGLGPRRGELYVADPSPVIGHEQGGRRPYLVISVNRMNRAPARLTIAVPLTTTDWGNPLHVRIDPDENGLSRINYAMPEMARSLSALRFGHRLGRVSTEIVDTAARYTGVLIGLGRSR